jgi:hypothetical protein
MATDNKMGLETQMREKPRGTVAVEELKKAIANISYSIFKAQDSLTKLRLMGMVTYNGISVSDLEGKLGLVEQTQEWLEREFSDTDLWR